MSQLLYVADFGSNNVTVVNTTTNALVGNLSVGDCPDALAYDNHTDEIFVANVCSNNLTIIGGKDHVVVGWLPEHMGGGPDGIAFDPENGYVYVSDGTCEDGACYVTVINGSNFSVVTDTQVGRNPEGIAYDSENGYLYVANTGSGNISILNGQTDRVIGSIPLGTTTVSVVCDPSDGLLFAIAGSGGNATVISTINDTVIGSIPAGSYPSSGAFDPESEDLYVASWDTGTVLEVRARTGVPVGTISVGSEPDGIVIDALASTLYVANYGSDTISVIPASGGCPACFPVTLEETGLPTSTYWSAALYPNLQSSLTPLVQFAQPNGSYSFWIPPVVGFSPNPQSGTITVSGLPVSESITFSPSSPAISAITFQAIGLPLSSAWSVSLATSPSTTSGSSLTFFEPNGTYSFLVAQVPGYTSTPVDGSVTVDGAPVTVPIRFTPTIPVIFSFAFALSSSPGAGYYWTTLLLAGGGVATGVFGFSLINSPGAVIGLGYAPGPCAIGSRLSSTNCSAPTSGNWYAVVEYSTNQTIADVFQSSITATFWSSNSLVLNSSFQLVLVTNTALAGSGDEISAYSTGIDSVSGTFVFTSPSPSVFPLDIYEIGLPLGAGWSFKLNGVSVNPSSNVQPLEEPNGSWSVVIEPEAGFDAVPSSFMLQMQGGFGMAAVVTFFSVPALTPVLFTESGLAVGTSWTVTYDGLTLVSANSTIVFQVSNGSYFFAIGAIPGWSANPSSGTLAVSGAPTGVAVVFARTPTYAVTFVATGLPAGTNWSVSVNGSAAKTTNGSVVIYALNGTQPYAAPPLLYTSGAWYGTTFGSGTFSVAGADVEVPIPYSPLPGIAVTFGENGLSGGQAWSVMLGNPGYNETRTSTRSSLDVIAPETAVRMSLASSGYGVASVAGPAVVNRSWLRPTGPSTVRVTFGHAESLTFAERGLGTGVAWTVTVDSAEAGGPPIQNATTMNSSLTLSVVEGAYKWTVKPSTTEYEAKPTHGAVGVGVAPKVVKVAFKELTSKVTFEEKGLPRHTAWEVEIAGVGTYELTGASLTVRLPNGTYNYTVTSSNPKYSASSPTGTLTVATPTAVKVGETFTDPVVDVVPSGPISAQVGVTRT